MRKRQPVWDKAQSLLHKDDKGKARMENAYGKLEYVKEEEKENQGQKRNGFVLEAKEAPGTPLHTEKEKRLQLDKVSKVKMKDERFLYAEEKPFREQAFFYDISEWEKSRDFMNCMKRMLKERGHQTLKDTFGFLEQSPERLEKESLQKERAKELSLEEFASLNHELDALNERLMKKEAKERQLYAQLQLMIDRGKEGRENEEAKSWTYQEAFQTDRKLWEADTDGEGIAEGQTEPEDEGNGTEGGKPEEEQAEAGFSCKN